MISNAIKCFVDILFGVCFAIAVNTFTSDFLDWVMPLNESRTRHLLVLMETFGKEEEYYYFISFVLVFIAFVACFAVVGGEYAYTMWLLHCSGLLAITR